MKEFLLAFRADWEGMPKVSDEEAKARTQMWIDWIGTVAAQGKLVSGGNRLFPHGKVVRANNKITDGPFAESKETIGGYSIIKAASYEEAVEIAAGCPILQGNGAVEVREISPM